MKKTQVVEEKIAPPETLGGQPCPVCNKKTLTLTEAKREVPFFGKLYVFSMLCSSCNYFKADVESDAKNEPVKYTLEVSEEADLSIRVIKSSNATVKIPHVGSLESGPASNGFITNVEGLINRFKKIAEQLRDAEEDKAKRKKAKNLIKKLQNVLWGNEKLKIIIEDPTGNSAIISDKAVRSKLK